LKIKDIFGVFNSYSVFKFKKSRSIFLKSAESAENVSQKKTFILFEITKILSLNFSYNTEIGQIHKKINPNYLIYK
jgi:hypothetical protein